MKRKVVVVWAIIILTSTLLIHTTSTDYLTHENLEIAIDNRTISATFSIKKNLDDLVPGVVVFHGFSANKEMMRPFTEGLALNGFAVLTVDQQGHGSSSGKLGGEGQNSLMEDGLELVKYLRNKEGVDANQIGVLGHSMGGGTSIQVAMNDSSIRSTVIIGNDLNGLNLSTSNPKNLLMAIGIYEELFDVSIAFESMKLAVGTDVETKVTYGNFSDGTARKIITPKTNHIFEVGNPEIIQTSIEWLYSSLNIDKEISNEDYYSEILGFKMMVRAMLSSLIGFLWMLVIPIVFNYLKREEYENIDDIRIISHGSISFIAFLIGAIFLVFGFSGVFVGWFSVGSLFYYLMIKRRTANKDNFVKTEILNHFSRNLIIGLISFFALFIPMQLILEYTHWDFRYVLPFFSELSLQRFGLMFIFWIPGTFFFTLEIHNLGYNRNNPFKSFLKYFTARIWLFTLVLVIQYLPIMIIGKSVLPGMFGFLAFFIVGMMPIMLVLSGLTVAAKHLKIHSLSTGIVIAGYIAWALSSTLPFNA